MSLLNVPSDLVALPVYEHWKKAHIFLFLQIFRFQYEKATSFGIRSVMSEKPEKQQRKLFVAVLAVAVALRVGLIFYSVYHDAHSNLKYTDVDYRVFSDAARYVFDRRICGDCQAQGPLTQLLDLNIGECVFSLLHPMIFNV
jgi:hypothetical protein